ncbi:MAG TPA: hypothetical protein VN752_04425 [Solirubrobacterales bacterium]|nr:hypothetical protein [Solirubrobacterales bacterium]
MPVVIVVLPVVVLLAVSVLSASTFGVATGVIVGALSILGAQLGRDRGRNLQDRLWSDWGGAPTTQSLRLGASQPSAYVSQCRAETERLLTDALPSREEEKNDPAAADERYVAAVRSLIARTRDRKRFPLLFEENVNYGFRRNCLGLRRYGIGVCVAVGIAAVALLIFGSGAFGSRLTHWSWPLVTALGLGVFWLKVVSPDWVRLPADAYACCLFEAVMTL